MIIRYLNKYKKTHMTYPYISRQYRATLRVNPSSSYLSQHELYVKIFTPISWVNDRDQCIN